MRRAVFAILGTAAATSLLVGLKANADPQQPTGVAQQDPAPGPASAPPSSAGGAPAGQQPAQPAQPAAPPPAAGGTRKIEGDTVGTPYGAVTVTITVSGDKVTDITAVLPTAGESGPRSADAGPKLRKQALAKQSADIDSVSGATYTSEGYKESLQSALDKR
jgi:FMN-binding protein